MKDSTEEGHSDAETTYYDSLCPSGDNQEYVAKLKADIMNLRKEYAKTRKDLGDENLVKRSFLEDLARTKTNMTRRNTSLNLKDRHPNSGLPLSTKGDVWFGSGRFQDSGERMRRRYSESKVERGRMGRNQEFLREGRTAKNKEPKDRILLKTESSFKSSKGNDLEENQKIYKEIKDAVKVKSPANHSYGRERMAAWLLSSRLQ